MDKFSFTILILACAIVVLINIIGNFTGFFILMGSLIIVFLYLGLRKREEELRSKLKEMKG